MRTTKLLLSIALVALAATLYGITSSFVAEFAAGTTEVVHEEALDMEYWMSSPFQVSLKGSDLVMEDWMSDPFRSSHKESDLVMEDWMSVPFRSSLTENELLMENWMSTPFETDTEEEALTLESWMTTPFEVNSDAGIEQLMCVVCI